MADVEIYNRTQADAATAAAVATRVPNGAVGAPSGVAPLDAGSRVPDANLPTRLSEASLSSTFGPSGALPMRAYGSAAASYRAGSPSRMSWLTFGDSVAQGVFEEMFDDLRRAWGGTVAGVFFTGSSRSVTAITSTGTIVDSTTAYDAWPTGIVSSFAAGATREYGVGGAAFICDTIKIYYVLEPGAGSFKVQVDGADAAGFTNVSAVGALGTLGVATITPARGAHTAKIVALTGTVRVVGVGFVDSTASGIVTVNVSKGGLGLSDAVTPGAMGNWSGLLADLSPTVISFEMKDTLTGWDAALTGFLDATVSGAPDSDVLLYASSPVGSDDAAQVSQNAILRTKADDYGLTFYDEYRVFGSFDQMVSQGFIDGGELTHYNTAGKQFIASMVLRDLGLLARLDDGNRLIESARIEQGQSFGADASDLIVSHTQVGSQDLVTRVKREWQIVPRGTGAVDAYSWVMRPDNSGIQQVPDGVRLGSAGPFLRNNSADILRPMSARSGGSLRDLQGRNLLAGVVTLSGQSGAVTLDLALGSVFLVNLTGNVTSWAFSNAVTAGNDIEVHFIQDSTGSRTLAGKSGSILLSGGAVTLTTTASRRDVLRFRFAGGAYVETSRSMNVG